MEADWREDFPRRVSDSSSAPQVELASINVTAVEITEEEEEDDDGSLWSARKRQSNGEIHHDDPERKAEDSFRSEFVASPSNRFSLKSLTLASMVAAGIQFGWALQLSLLTPYVQTLGIDHALASFIWLCGPITGLVVQPCVGIWSDQCKSKWGRRRPYIVVGTIMVAASVSVIGYAADVGYLLGDSFTSCGDRRFRPRAAFIFIIGFWLLDLANNTVQGPARALVADLAGPDQRESGNAIFCLWIALGNILGFSTGASGSWHKWFPFLQSKACCEACANLKAAFIIAVLFLGVCTAVTFIFAKETPLGFGDFHSGSEQQHEEAEDSISFPNEPDEAEKHGPLMLPVESQQANGHVIMRGGSDRDFHRNSRENGFHSVERDEEKIHSGTGPGAVIVSLLMGIRKLPPPMKMVLVVMAFCWLSWFPFFLFDTDWMGREVYRGDPNGDEIEAQNYDDGVRAGAFGLLLNSVVLAISSFLIDPMCRRFGSKHVWAMSNYLVFVCMSCTAIVTLLAGDVHHDANGRRVYVHSTLVKYGAIILFTVLGFPLSITYSVPYAITAELISDSGGGQGLAMGILNLAVVIPQMSIALGAGPWDALFGGGNQPAFILAGVFALVAGIVATKYLPRLSQHGYHRAAVHGFG